MPTERPVPIGLRKLKSLKTPEKIQDFLCDLPFNHEKGGETYMSVERALEKGKAHCFEGALIAAAALWFMGERPLVMDLKATGGDMDHVVALFRRGGRWGAISKTNHAVLRYREPIYRNLRELALSYFHEYFLSDGTKTLRSYSRPFDLRRFDTEWLTGRGELFHIVAALDASPHEGLLPKGHRLRKAERIEIEAGKLVEWKK